jgi:hypothetical protein
MHSIYVVLLAALTAALLGFSNLHANGFPTRPAISSQLQTLGSRVSTQLAAMILQGDAGVVWIVATILAVFTVKLLRMLSRLR